MPEILSLPRMARVLGVTQAWLRDAAVTGKLPALKAGRHILFNKAAVLDAVGKLAQGGAK